MPMNVSTVLGRADTDEYVAPKLDRTQQEAIHRAAHMAHVHAPRLASSSADYASSRRGTASGLVALNEAFGIDRTRCPPTPASTPTRLTTPSPPATSWSTPRPTSGPIDPSWRRASP